MQEDVTFDQSGPERRLADESGAARDRTLLRRMAQGDESAMAELYDRLASRVQTVVLQMVGDADEAEDVVEETFWQAWRTAGSYDARRGSVATWLLVAARSRALDFIRARRRRAEWKASPATLGALAEGASQRSAMPDTHPVDAERSLALSSALRELPSEQREAVEMAFLEGLSHSQIAERTGQPLGTVKTRIRTAMRKLGARLAFLHEEEA